MNYQFKLNTGGVHTLACHQSPIWGDKVFLIRPQDSATQQSLGDQWTSISVLSSYPESKSWLQLIHIHIPLMFSPLYKNGRTCNIMGKKHLIHSPTKEEPEQQDRL